MKTAFEKTLRIAAVILAGLVILVLGLVGGLAYARSSSIRAAQATLGRPADVLRVDGVAFRDLDKSGTLDPYEDRRLPVTARVEDLLARMTLEEKAGLLFHTFVVPGPNGEMAGVLEPMNVLPVEVALAEKRMSHFNLFGLDGASDTARWTNAVQRLAERTRLGIPVTFSSDPRHSPETSVATFTMREFSRWPEPIGFAAIGDPALVEEFGRIAAREYRAIGIHVALHPMADVATEPRWGRISGTFGEDTDLAARLTAAYVRGFQGDELGPASVATVTKHFAGGGPQEDGWDPHFRYGKNQVYPGRNLEYHLIPFRSAIAAGTALMMPYYGVPVGQTSEDVAFGFNREMVTGLLRGSLRFDGIVLSDWTLLTPPALLGVTIERFYPIAGAKDYGVEDLPPVQKARKALDAGVDQFGGEMSPEYVLDLVREGAVSTARVDESARRLLALKFRLGLFDDPYVPVDEVARRVGTPEAKRLGEETQRRSQVLLTNGARDGTPNGTAMLPLTPGLRIHAPGFDAAMAARYGTVVATLEEADVAILRPDPPYDHDRGSLLHQGRLYYTESELLPLLRVMREKPTVVTVYLERPLVIPEIVASARAVLANFGATDDAVLDVVFGRARPEGRLPFDLPSSWESVLRQKPDVPFDAERPLFRFGHGLRYDRSRGPGDSIRNTSS